MLSTDVDEGENSAGKSKKKRKKKKGCKQCLSNETLGETSESSPLTVVDLVEITGVSLSFSSLSGPQ